MGERNIPSLMDLPATRHSCLSLSWQWTWMDHNSHPFPVGQLWHWESWGRHKGHRSAPYLSRTAPPSPASPPATVNFIWTINSLQTFMASIPPSQEFPNFVPCDILIDCQFAQRHYEIMCLNSPSTCSMTSCIICQFSSSYFFLSSTMSNVAQAKARLVTCLFFWDNESSSHGDKYGCREHSPPMLCQDCRAPQGQQSSNIHCRCVRGVGGILPFEPINRMMHLHL